MMGKHVNCSWDLLSGGNCQAKTYAAALTLSMCVSVAEVSGTQKSADPLWNKSKITYWGVTDLLGGKLSQRGYYNSIHADK
jgi:hypothetical protein